VSDVTKMLDELIAGQKTVEEVAEDFRGRDWPVPTPTGSRTLEDVETRALDDPPVEPEGSFAEVATYFYRHKIDLATYTTLATAAAEAMDARQNRPGTPAVAPASTDDEEHL
jgi:hypothetical protein